MTQSTITTNDLVAINLRFDAGTAALNVRALAQVAAKALFVAGRLVSLSTSDVAREAAKILGVRRVSAPAIEEALSYLLRIGAAKRPSDRWQLSSSQYDEIAERLERGNTRLGGVLDRHFPKRIDQARLASWFQDACVEFYGLFGVQWAASIRGRVAGAQINAAVLASLLDSCIQRAGLNIESDALTSGFHSFVMSDHQEDVEHQWSLGQALLAAKLVAAKIGADPITATDMKGLRLLLDTNVLLVVALESHKLTGAMAMLGEVLAQLEVSLWYTDVTREEYGRVVEARGQQVLAVVDQVAPAVLQSVDDAFLESAMECGCHTLEEFRAYFDGLLDPPSVLDGSLAITLLVDGDAQRDAEAGMKNEVLKSEILSVWAALRWRPKGRRALEHDAALLEVADGLARRGEKCCVLTLDRTMHEFALRRAGPRESPRWISLDALIQVLAADGAGPDADASVFAPLMSRLIRHQCEAMFIAFGSEDLGIMLDIEQRCAQLPPEEIKSVATMVARHRLAGKPADDKELALAVQRAFRRSADATTVGLERELSAEASARRGAEIVAKTEAKRREMVSAQFIDTRARELRSGATRRLLMHFAAGAFAAVALGFIALLLTLQFVATDTSAADFVALLIASEGPSLAGPLYYLRKTAKRWQARGAESGRQAQNELDGYIGRNGPLDEPR